ncbi:MAG: Uma2 family endonuclease [Saprospiraceae bacterium]
MLKDDIFTDDSPTTSTDYETERNKPMPNRIHGTIQTKISVMLTIEFGDKYDFPNEVTLATTPASTPDICIFPKRELDWATTEAKEQEVPITTIEIVSPSQSLDEMAKKIWQTYFPIGVQSAWIVMPPPFKAIYVLTPDGGKHFFDQGTLTDAATGVELEVEKVFEGLK